MNEISSILNIIKDLPLFLNKLHFLMKVIKRHWVFKLQAKIKYLLEVDGKNDGMNVLRCGVSY